MNYSLCIVTESRQHQQAVVSRKLLQARHVSAGLPSQQSAADFYILHLKIQIQGTTGLLIATTAKTQTS